MILLWQSGPLAQEADEPSANPETPALSAGETISNDPLKDALGNLPQEIEVLSKAAEKHLNAMTDRSAALVELARGLKRSLTLLDEARADNATLRVRIVELTDEIERAHAANALLEIDADGFKIERDELRQQLSELRSQLVDAVAAQEQADRRLAEQRAHIAELETLLKAQRGSEQRDAQEIDRLTRQIAKLETDLAALGVALGDAEAKLAQRERENAERDAQLEAATNASQVDIERLTRQITELREQLSRLKDALAASDRLVDQQEAQIVDLGKRLSESLAARIEQLESYRSEFFGRLRDVLGNKRGISIAGDRFLLQSDVLFASGSAELSAAAQEELSKLARTLQELAAEIPDDVAWILRVDGHTDRVPIHTVDYDSNWDLSTARAVSVVNLLIREGLPPSRLAATGFGEYQPIDLRGDEIALHRNRRIEFRLTSP